jgi:hypothetical protein
MYSSAIPKNSIDHQIEHPTHMLLKLMKLVEIVENMENVG